MLLHLLSERPRQLLLGVIELGDAGRRGRWGTVEQVFEDPLAPFDGRGSRWIRGDGEDAGLTEQPAALPVDQRHLAELVAGAFEGVSGAVRRDYGRS